MRFIATNQYELGVLAFGVNPIGIVAIGAFPVGLIAVGGVPLGLVSFACGVGFGGVTFSCGIGVGVYARVVGVAVGAWANAVGLGLALAGEAPTARPSRQTVPIDQALARAEDSWVRTRVDAEGRLESAAIPVEMDASAEGDAQRLRGRQVFARVRAVEPEPASEVDYRKSARPAEPYLHCTDVERAGERAPLFALLWYWLRVGVVGAAVVAVLGPVTLERLAMTKMTRVVAATWQARPAQAEGLYLEPDARCQLTARLRSDGTERLHADLQATCGSLTLVERTATHCLVSQRQTDGGHAYRLRCDIARVARTESDDGDTPERPGLYFDCFDSPGVVRIVAHGPPPMRVVLDVDPSSGVVEGEPLLIGGDASLDGSAVSSLHTILQME